ncbi:AAA family ATPase [Gloeobacter violaceus]|uniref:Gll1489 protein n=1 Tax=Gloeobacter violaceus (strain ATCC 29082 / PCC 7421) TaxID=251221 RepID=Q7NKI8_GLOVI|nr:AAA family ATPase [Gloeobacter violaceus]BAC89430.1 gll1489 [Gloeobacter violaceus PCC 7421]
MLKRVKIKGYKSLENLEVDLKPLSVFFGPNAAGKSNFLDALQLLSRIVNSKNLKQAFDPPYRGTPLESFTFGARGLQGLLTKETATFMIEVDVELSPIVIESVNNQIREMKKRTPDSPSSSQSKAQASVREKNLRYRIEVEVLPKSGILRVADEYLAALNTKGEPTGKRTAFLERRNDRLHLRMEGQSHPTYYEQYLDHSILSLPLYPPHYPHLVAVRQELANWFFFYFEPRERMRTPNPVKEVRHIGLMGEELASFLNTLRALDEPQFRAVERTLHTIIPSVTGIDVHVNALGEVELLLIEGEKPVPARVLSEGTLRILGLLALGGAKEPPALIGFEEPENGIHPRRIKLIAQLLRTRVELGSTQLMATTHSPVLADLIPVDSLYVFRKVKGSTDIIPFTKYSLGGLWYDNDKDKALNEEEDLSASERIMRGDFDS